jgi:hypothetical protein
VARVVGNIARMDDLEAAWAELQEVNASLGWYVGLPAYWDRRDEQLYAFDPAEHPKVGHRRREWTAVAPTQERVVLAMARCLREVSEGRAPR